MQQYQVPQFITIEDRIIGPLTLKQFLYLLGAAAIGFIGWSLLHFILFILITLPVAGLFVAMAFLKINDRPLPAILAAAIGYYLKPRLYLWRKTPPPLIPKKAPTPAPPSPLAGIPKLSESKLDDLAWSLDIKERLEDRG
ncbi:MAG: PrgI family protein [Candidatus Sungbacteria bacterium]|uniref:PrgI family protein n=1 Tax=Candidatus Sungiibacteriota bacterium TaxID=2750080 RepID=A0A933DRH4_9BACT|nr:PrgI family protein [Candidatus Sungbacteria bacterium]